eukprot:12930803-Prorocentrum_lima.AAC.1
MGLKSVLFKIGMEEGIQWKMHNEALRWSGTNDIVSYMAGTYILEYNAMTELLLKAYQDMKFFPQGAPINAKWMARHVRKLNAGNSVIDVDQSVVDEYQ